MKILIVSHLFAPSNAIGSVRVTKFARFLHDAGHDVRVLAARDPALPQNLPLEIPAARVTYVESKPRRGLIKRSLKGYEQSYRSGEATMSPIVVWLHRMYRAILQIPDVQAGWCQNAIGAGEQLLADWKPDLIFSSALPITSLVVASALAGRHGIRFVAEMRDLWVDSHYYDMPFWRRWLDERTEQRCLGNAELLVTVSEPLAEVLRRKYRKPVVVVLNGFDPADFPSFSEPVSAPNEPVNIVYTGLIYPNRQRDPSPLFAALKQIGATSADFRVRFVGRLLSEVMVIAREHGVEHLVDVGPAVPYQEALDLQAHADVLLLVLWDSKQEKGVYTGKLFEYLGARRPILMIGPTEGVAADLIRARHAGAVLNDPPGIAAYLRDRLREKRETGRIAPLPEDVGYGLRRVDQFGLLERAFREGASAPTNRKRKVLVVCNSLGIGGTERHLLQVLPQIDRDRFDVQLFALCPGGVIEEGFRSAGIKVVAPVNAEGIGVLAGAYAFMRTLRTERPDIVHFFLPRAYLACGWMAVAMSQSGLIMSRRSLNEYRRQHPLAWRMETHLHRHMRRLVGNSRAVVRQLRDESDRRSQIDLIYNGIEIPVAAAMPRAEARRVTGTPPDAIVVVIVANLIPYKGHRDLLDALAILRGQGLQNLLLLCIGRDEGILGELKKAVTELGIDDVVHWVGEQVDVWPWLRSADIGVLCSHEEDFANAILEGMAAGLPMIVTDVGGNAEAVVDGETGIVVPPKSPESLAKALAKLAASPELRGRLSAKALGRVREHFSLQQCVLAYENLYEDVAR